MRRSIPMLALALAASAVAIGWAQPESRETRSEDRRDAEHRIIAYVKENLKPGEPLIVSKLYNEVFTSPEERSVLDKLNGSFFRVPLFVVEFEGRQGRLPTLDEIAGQFDFYGPEESSVVLSILESDPRVPKFITRDASTGELVSIDIEKVKADERFNKALTRTLTGWEGKPLPPIEVVGFDGSAIDTASYVGHPFLVYVWFTNCPPCVKIGPELVALQKTYSDRGFAVLGLNADRVLKLQYDDAYRAEYAAKIGINYQNAHLTDQVRAALGNVNIFPTLFLVDSTGTIAKHYVNFQSRETLGPEIERLLSMSTSKSVSEQVGF